MNNSINDYDKLIIVLLKIIRLIEPFTFWESLNELYMNSTLLCHNESTLNDGLSIE